MDREHRDEEAEAGRAGWEGKGRLPRRPLLTERLHLRGLLTALASKPVHVLGGRPHHLVCLKLSLVLCSVHLEGRMR